MQCQQLNKTITEYQIHRKYLEYKTLGVDMKDLDVNIPAKAYINFVNKLIENSTNTQINKEITITEQFYSILL